MIDLDDLLVARIFVRDLNFREARLLGGVVVIIALDGDGRERRGVPGQVGLLALDLCELSGRGDGVLVGRDAGTNLLELVAGLLE